MTTQIGRLHRKDTGHRTPDDTGETPFPVLSDCNYYISTPENPDTGMYRRPVNFPNDFGKLTPGKITPYGGINPFPVKPGRDSPRQPWGAKKLTREVNPCHT